MPFDSICEAGANINLKVFDTNNRLDAINQLNTTAVKPDLIIGPAPKWLEYDANNQVAKVVAVPAREDIDLPIEEHLIVELYSK